MISDTITDKSDKSGDTIQELLTGEHEMISKLFCSNSVRTIRMRLINLLKNKPDFIFTIGGTGISRKDVTIDAVKPFIHKDIPGFSELFRQLSYQEIGSKAILSRAVMFITKKGSVICCLPGSPNAAKLVIGSIIVPEYKHILGELSK